MSSCWDHIFNAWILSSKDFRDLDVSFVLLKGNDDFNVVSGGVNMNKYENLNWHEGQG